MKGIVFDVRRFSTHDGAGIRTTVFLKGCPLRCIWCQNPEGLKERILPVRMEKTCIQCRRCVELSKNCGAYLDDGKVRIDRNKIDNWTAMIDQCPSGALMMDSRCYTSEELVQEVMRDEVFFSHGGGVTFSGGEPLLQTEFIEEVLRKLKGKGVHTAIETSLSVSSGKLEKVLPLLDCIYADMKVFDESEHKKYTGFSNVLIKQNLKLLLTSIYKSRVIIRTPLIPTYTATEENLGQIAEYLSEIYPDVSYELLNYNPLAEAKYHLVDKKYCFKENPKLYSNQQMAEFGRIVKKHGIKNLIMQI